jgi:Zn-dependent alcohol dehydrogenase
VLDPTTDDVTARTRALTDVGADYAFEVVGRGSLVTTALWATRNGGTVVCVGAAPLGDSITIDPAALFTISEKKLLGCALGSCNSLREIPRLIGLWRTGRRDLAGLNTTRRPLAEVNEALAELRAGRGIRTVLAH